MSDMFEIPAFLRRIPTGDLNMANNIQHAAATAAVSPAKAPRQKRSDCYVATVKIKIPLDMSNSATLTAAIDAVQSIEKTLPKGSTAEVTATLGKM